MDVKPKKPFFFDTLQGAIESLPESLHQTFKHGLKVYLKVLTKLSIQPWKFTCKLSIEHCKFAYKLSTHDWKFAYKLSIENSPILKIYIAYYKTKILLASLTANLQGQVESLYVNFQWRVESLNANFQSWVESLIQTFK